VTLFPALTPTLPPATHTNSYALGARDVLLVEPATPYDDEQRAWLEWARALPSAGRTPVAIFATHHHPDHVGGIEVLARELGLPVWGHALTADRVPDVPFARRLVDGEEIVLGGPRNERWRVLHTPGHAQGHLCLHEEASGTVIVGDMVASVGTILIAPGDGDMTVYLDQLRRLSGLGARLALPAHGEPIDAPSALFDKYVKHRLMREDKVLGALRQAPATGWTAAELLERSYDDVPVLVLPIAAFSLAAHLEKLIREGKVKEKDGRYVVVSHA
jgi:glyoxylase-like metal-dependent hydrolase (beta-lactamase superfamily II)